MRNVVSSAFKIDAHTVTFENLTDIICTPAGDIVFGICLGGYEVKVIDAFTLDNAIPPVPLPSDPVALAISPDGKCCTLL